MTEKDSLDKTTCYLIFKTLAKRSPSEQSFFQDFILNEWGGLNVSSKEEAIQILNDPDASFEKRIAAHIFAEGYKQIISIASRVPPTTKAEIPTLNRLR